MTEYVKCAMRNLGRKRFRTALTIASIAIGVASVVLIDTIGNVGQYAINQELGALGLGSISISVDKQRNDIVLEESDLAVIEGQTYVESAVPVIMEYSSITMRSLVGNAAIWGVGSGADQIFALTPKYGSLFTSSDISSGANVCLLDVNTASSFYHRENIVGKRLQLLIGGSYEEFTVVGVVESGGNAMQSLLGQYLPMFVYVPYTTLKRLSGRAGFDQIAVTVSDAQRVEQTAGELVRALERESGTDGAYRSENIAQQKDQLNNLLGIVKSILSTVAGISLVVAGLGIMTVMLVSVNERTREIGIKKSIGASRTVIMAEFLFEAFLISLLGGGIGAGTGLLLALLGCAAVGVKLITSVGSIVFAVLFAVVLGVMFGVYPSWIACSMRPVDALRFE